MSEMCLCHGERCKMRRDDPRHGSANGYGNLFCRCEQCCTAHTDYMYKRKQARIARPVPEHVHGSPNGYGAYGCRCRSCTDAWSADCIDRRHRRQQGLTDVAQGRMPAPVWRFEDRPHKRRSA